MDEKKEILNKLNLLLIQFEKMFKLVQNQYCISSQNIKKLHITKFKKFFRIYKTHCENIGQKRSLYNILKRSLCVSQNDVDLDLGEENEHLFDVSKLNTLLNNAKIITKKTDEYIEQLEELIKNSNMINPDDPGYKNYLSFQKSKMKMIRQNNINNAKYILIVVILIIVISIILYFVIVNRIDDLLIFKE